jgi:peptide/nickel transport system permease protein
MLRYLLRRVFWAVPTLLVVSLVIFGLGKCSNANSGKLELAAYQTDSNQFNFANQERTARQAAKQANLDKPLFYFTLTTAAYPDTLYRVWLPSQRERMERLTAATGNWSAVQQWERRLRRVQEEVVALPDTFPEGQKWRTSAEQLSQADDLADLAVAVARFAEMGAALPTGYPLATACAALQTAADTLCTQQRPERMRRPALHWHGLDNQYHEWVSGFVTGDLGLDREGVSIAQLIGKPLMTTLTVNGLALLLAYALALPLGVYMARWQGRPFDRWSQRILLLVYALPAFSLALSLTWFLGVTPATPAAQLAGQPFGHWFFQNFSAFALPIFILALGTLAVLAFQMRGGMLDALRQPYIRTARAKGLSEQRVHWHHAFRNALFPIITVFGSVFPSIFSGALVVELLFHYEGIGKLVASALNNDNHPLLFALLMFAAMFTVAGTLIADVLYAWADPRVRYAKEG